MKQYVIRCCYSQTDQINVIVKAPDKTEAMRFANLKFCNNPNGAHHVEYVCEVSHEIYRCDFR